MAAGEGEGMNTFMQSKCPQRLLLGSPGFWGRSGGDRTVQWLAWQSFTPYGIPKEPTSLPSNVSLGRKVAGLCLHSFTEDNQHWKCLLIPTPKKLTGWKINKVRGSRRLANDLPQLSDKIAGTGSGQTPSCRGHVVLQWSWAVWTQSPPLVSLKHAICARIVQHQKAELPEKWQDIALLPSNQHKASVKRCQTQVTPIQIK